jgi:hypothetical protein
MNTGIRTEGLEVHLSPLNPSSYPGRGRRVLDVSGNGNHALLEGGASFAQNAFVLGGEGQYLSTTYKPNLDNGTAFSWELWFWDDTPGLTTGSITALIGNYSTTTTPSVILLITNSGAVSLTLRNDANESEAFTTQQTITDGVWHHVVAVGTSTQQNLYIDGELVDSRARVLGVVTSTQNISIGGNHLGRYQTCRIGSVRLYRGVALSATDIQRHYLLERPFFGLSRVTGPPPRGRARGNPTNVIRRIQGQQTSGVYWVQPPGFRGEAFPVYIDFDNDGGAWVLIAKYGSNDKTLDKLFAKAAVDTSEDGIAILTPEFSGAATYARLSRDQMNALWGVSNHVVRAHHERGNDTRAGVYFQRKITNTDTFDLWHGLANSSLWSDGSLEGTTVTHGGIRWEASFAWPNTDPSVANYNATITNSAFYNTVTHTVTFNGSPRFTTSNGYGMLHNLPTTLLIPSNGNEPLTINTNMGLFAGITTTGQQMLNANPSDSAFNTNLNRQTILFLRCDTSAVTPVQPPPVAALSSASLAVATPHGAWSLRSLLPSYREPHLKVRRERDNQEAHIWFGRQGDILRVQEIASGRNFAGSRGYQAWAGSDVVYIVTWYDQSPQENHAITESASTQPIFSTYDTGLFAVSQDDSDGQTRYLVLKSDGGVLPANPESFGAFAVAQMGYGSQPTTVRPYLQAGESNAVNMALTMSTTEGLGLDHDPPSAVETPSSTLAIGTSIAVASWERVGGDSNVNMYANPPNGTSTVAYETYTGGALEETTTGYRRQNTEGAQQYNTSKLSELVVFDADVSTISDDIRQSMVQYTAQRRPVLRVNPFARTLLNIAIAPAVQTHCQAAFSLRLVRREYTGPIVRIRRSTDNSLQDFFANPDGKLGTIFNGNGLAFDTWLGSTATGFVVTWYDQSENENHATQSDTNMQPAIQRSGSSDKYIVSFDGTKYMTFDGSGTSSIFHNTNYSVVAVERRQAADVAIYLIGTLTSALNKGLTIGYRADGTFTHAQFTNDYNMTIPAYNAVDEPFRFWCSKHSSSTGKETILNGETLGTSANTTPLSEPGQAALGTNHNATQSYIGELAEVLVFNTDLANEDIASVYTNQLAYIAPVTNTALTGQFNACLGAFGLRLLVPSYTGAVVRMRRGSDNTTRDFYANRAGRLGDTAGGRGLTVEDWLNGSVGYVDTWYDQTGTGNATQATTSLQPVLVRDGTGYAVQFLGSNVGFALSNKPNTILTIATHVKLRNKGTGSNDATFHGIVNAADGNGYRTVSQDIYGGALLGSRFNADFLAPSNSYWYIENQPGSMTGVAADGSGTGFTGRRTHENGVWQYIVAVRDRVPNPSLSFNYASFSHIGTVSGFPNRSMQGLMSEMFFFTSKLSESEAGVLYSARPVFVDGRDLFSQLPVRASTAAVAAYGVRLLNANYFGPCVQVRRSSDNATKDFFADVDGNLGDAYLGNGESLATWLEGATAAVVTWYDQSGSGNHATEIGEGGLDGPYGNPVLSRVGRTGSRYTMAFDSNPLQTPSNERYRGTMAIIYQSSITGGNPMDEAGSLNVILSQNEDNRSVLAANRTRVGVRNGDDVSNEVVFSEGSGRRLWILPDNPIRFGTVFGTTDEGARTRSFKGEVDLLLQFSEQFGIGDRNSMRVALEGTYGRAQTFIGNTHSFGGTVQNIQKMTLQTVVLTTGTFSAPGVSGNFTTHLSPPVTLPSDYLDSNLVSWDVTFFATKRLTAFGWAYPRIGIDGSFNTSVASGTNVAQNFVRSITNRTEPLNKQGGQTIQGYLFFYSFSNLVDCYFQITIRYMA